MLSGALIAYSGTKTGRSPKDKRVVKHPDSAEHVWWGSVNVPIEDATFQIRKERAIDYLTRIIREGADSSLQCG